MTGFDWPALMRAGLRPVQAGGAGLQPGVFWSLTPAELLLILGREGANAPMGRARLEELARAFPDRDPGGSAAPGNSEQR
jgi:uncharacterized phage protein (TIGR02216 family)